MSDQHHAGVMGCAGDAIAKTPNIDRLAREGVRFSNAYCSFPLCGPSRMSFMTCRHPYEIGLWDNVSQLNSDTPTFAHSFLAAGYDTVLAGRMHFVGGTNGTAMPSGSLAMFPNQPILPPDGNWVRSLATSPVRPE